MWTQFMVGMMSSLEASWLTIRLRDGGRLPSDNLPTPRELRKLSRNIPKPLKLNQPRKKLQQVKRHQ